MESDVDGESIGQETYTVHPNTREEFKFYGDALFGPAYEATSGGEKEVELQIEHNGSVDSATTSADLGTIDAEIHDISTTFYSNYDGGYDLSRVEFSVENTGDLEVTLTDIEIEIAGHSRGESILFGTTVQPGEAVPEYIGFTTDPTLSKGEYELSVRVLSEGDVVASKTKTVTVG